MFTEDFMTVEVTDSNTNSSGYVLEPDMYDAVCVGLVVRTMDNFDKTAKQDKLMFVYQIAHDSKVYYVKSAPMTISLHEKAALWKFLKAWTKQADPKALATKIGVNGKFAPAMLLGKPIRLTIDNEEYNGKTYNRLKECMAPKANQAFEVDLTSGYPEYLAKDAKSQIWVKGLTQASKATTSSDVVALTPEEIAEVTPKATTNKASKPVKVAEDKDPDALPF